MKIREIPAIRLCVRTAAALVALAALAVPPSAADTFSFSAQKRQIRACILVSDDPAVGGRKGLRDYAPFVFYALDKRTDLKPSGWEFVNPLAPGFITPTLQSYMKNRDSADPTLGSPAAQINAPLGKNILGYWTVDLDTIGDNDLQKFDIALITLSSLNTPLMPEQGAKLRRFVDGGGTLWIEDESSTGAGNFTPDNLMVTPKFGLGTTSGSYTNVSHHPLMAFPYPLKSEEIFTLGAGFGGNHSDFNVAGQPINVNFMIPIVLGDGIKSRLSAGNYGAGRVVVSSMAIAFAVNQRILNGYTSPNWGPNTGAISGDNATAVNTANLKFLYNLAGWSSSASAAAANSRRSGSVSENIGGVLNPKWAPTPSASGNAGSGAAFYKGCVFVVDGANILHCYNARPGLTFSGTQNPDNGLPDFSTIGTSYDEIWNQQLPGNAASVRYSTPTLFSFNNPNNVPTDVVAVTSSTGVTSAFFALPTDAVGRLLSSTSRVWKDIQIETTATLGGAVNPGDGYVYEQVPGPVFADGWLFVPVQKAGAATGSGGPWRVEAIDPTSGKDIFAGTSTNVQYPAPSVTNPSPNGVPGFTSLVGPLTVGYVRESITGATDMFVFATTEAGGSTAAAGSVNPILFRVYNEPLSPEKAGSANYYAVGNRARIPWYNASGSLLGLAPVVRVVETTNGQITNVYQLRYGPDYTLVTDTTNGTRTQVNITAVIPADGAVYAEYVVDWGSSTNGVDMQTWSNVAGNFDRTKYVAFDSNTTAPAVRPTGPPAMTQDNMLVVATNNTQDNGTASAKPNDRLYGVRPQYFINANSGSAGGQNPVRDGYEHAWMWSPTGGSSAVSGEVPTRLVNNDPALATTGQIVTKFQIIGSPATANGVVYAVARGALGGGNYNATVIVALTANPSTTFSAGQSFAQGSIISLSQTNPSGSGLNEPSLHMNNNTGYTFNSDGTITITNFRTSSGDSFNTAMPIYVEVNGVRLGSPITKTNSSIGPLDNLLWFMIIPQSISLGTNVVSALDPVLQGIMPASGPTVVGDAIYFGTVDNRIVSVDLPNLNTGGQASLFQKNANGVYDASQPNFHANFLLRDAATGTPISQPIVNPPAATAGIVVAGTRAGAAALENQTTLIADATRLLEINSANQITWEMSGTRSMSVVGDSLPVFQSNGTTTGIGRVSVQNQNFARPNVAHRTSYSEVLVADVLNNRIVQLDHGGFALREIHRVNNDMQFMRPGEPVTLNEPTDVQNFPIQDLRTNAAISFTNPDTGVVYSYTGPYISQHYVVADSGNYRVLELVSATAPNGAVISLSGSDGSTVAMQNQVVFVTRSLAEQNARYRYRTIQEFFEPNLQKVFLIAAVDNARPGVADRNTVPFGSQGSNAESPGGALVVIDRSNNAGEAIAVVSSLTYVDSGGNVVRRQPISNPTYFKRFQVANPNTPSGNESRYLLADATGVYELVPKGNEAVIVWALSSADYLYLTGRPLRASCIQRLTQSDYDAANGVYRPHYLITNRYSGADTVQEAFNLLNLPHGDIKGEVFEVRGIDYFRQGGYQNPAIRLYQSISAAPFFAKNQASAVTWMSPEEVLPAAAGIAIKRRLGSSSSTQSTYLFDQPNYAERPF